ncbi:DUF1993 domain-containing protein [Phenylobacterium sp.]|uniref:DUF1993 domain-containing protein n=1 Tax=Phenylobacterium sp. TaxID=1871053 RepID=UPI002DE5D256|nr:DUF1993 domain-containing protein [Phenylobacterium sp.]
MSVNLFTFVGLYSQGLTTLDHVLNKGAELAKSKGVSEADMLEWRLVDDMNPLRFQARSVINFTRSWPSRVAGLDIPADIASDLDLAGLKAAIAEAKAHLASLGAAQFDGRDEVPLTVNLGQMEATLPAGQWLAGFATTNFYFHLSMAYAILRQRGADLGKRDLFAGGL